MKLNFLYCYFCLWIIIYKLLKSKVKSLYVHYADVGEDMDKRNYIVSYDKINKLGFQTSMTVEEGIDELKD